MQGQQFAQGHFIPKDPANQGAQPAEAVSPIAHVAMVAQQHVNEQCRPHLPAHRVGIVAEKIAQLEILFDLLEKHFDLPATLVEIAHAAWSPLGVVGDEGNLLVLAVDFDHRHYPAQSLRIGFTRLLGFEHDEVVAKDIAFPFFDSALGHSAGHVVFGPGHPEDSASAQLEEVLEVDIGFVENHDFPVQNACAELFGTEVVVVIGCFDDGEPRQKTTNVQAEMQFGGSFASPMFCPRRIVGYQLDGGGIDCVDRLRG